MQEPTNKASLGCGTLILIALIVMIFSNGNSGSNKELTRQVRDLQSEVRELKADIKTQSATLSQIRQTLDEVNKRGPAPRTQTLPEAPLPTDH